MVNSTKGLSEQAEMLAAGEVGSVELTESALDRIEASQATLNAFRLVRPEAARAEAEDADRRIAAGERRPLLGVPIAIKDDMDLAGEPTAFGCPGQFEPKSVDGAVAARLKAAGAVVVGKTNSPEVGLWPFTEGSAFGATRNPWSLDHSPGGSSGGAAAAVSAGLVSAAVGSDGAGSVRIPAAWTNLVGIKPQRGRISTWPDPEAFNGLTVIGPLAHTVADAALLLDVLSGNVDGRPSPSDPAARALCRLGQRARRALCVSPSPSTSPSAARPPVSIPRSAPPSSAWHGGSRASATSVEAADVPYGIWPGASIMPRSMAAIREWTSRVPDRSLLDPRVRESARHGCFLKPLLPAARLAERIGHRRVGRIFRRFDVVLAPTTAQPPLRDRRMRGAQQLADRQGDRRRLPLRLAVERAWLAGGERARWIYRFRPADRCPASGSRQQRGPPALTRSAAGGGRAVVRKQPRADSTRAPKRSSPRAANVEGRIGGDLFLATGSG